MNLISIISSIERNIPIYPQKYQNIAKKIYYWSDNYDVSNYRPLIHPFEIRCVDPKSIKYVTGRRWKPWSNLVDGIGSVLDGSWDTRPPKGIPDGRTYPRKFENHDIYIAFENHFINGVDWENTEHYSNSIDKFENNESLNVDRLLANLDKYDRIFESIKENGYKSQLDLEKTDQSFLDSLTNEVVVDIGSDGKILFVDGRHRLSIAKLLELNSIPVFILYRHTNWMEYFVKNNETSTEYISEEILLCNKRSIE